MDFQIHDGKWEKVFRNAFKNTKQSVRIITPFIQYDTISSLIGRRKPQIKLVTRFNLDDFYSGVSKIEALDYLLNNKNADIRGIKKLHAKLYIFDDNLALLTSANLSGTALNRNIEYGVIIKDSSALKQCEKYFDKLWTQGNQLTNEKISDWQKRIAKEKKKNKGQKKPNSLGDYGADYDFAEPSAPSTLPSTDIPYTDSEQAWVKFAGTSSDRANVSDMVLDEVIERRKPWRCYYPLSKAPRRVKDNDLIFFGMLTNDEDIKIYGYGFAFAHNRQKDIVMPKEINECDWKKDFPRFVSIYDPKFINGNFFDGVSFNQLKDKLGAFSFEHTKYNKITVNGENTNPHRAYLQQASVLLSEEGRKWLYNKLEQVFSQKGAIPSQVIENGY